MLFKYFSFILFVVTLFLSCESKPKIIVEDTAAASTEEGLQNEGMNTNVANPDGAANADVHQVLVDEVLQTDRYTYLKVDEKGRKYWLATAKTEAQKGQVYLYRGGLLKTNFESREYNRTFDTIYLVSNVIPASEHPGGNLTPSGTPTAAGAAPQNMTPAAEVKDAVKLSELFANKTKYDGKTITVSGECVKVNNGIMGRNWVHIQDGTKHDGKKADLTVTTGLVIPVGSKVALKGKIVLNKDFGAGYRYDVIMEEAGGM